jgi:hypothetical protein
MKTGKLRIVVLAAALLGAVVAPAQWIDSGRIEYNGRELRLNPEPIREGGTWMLPVRATADAIGAGIRHDGRNSRITWRDNTIEYSPGDNDFYMNGRRRSLGGRSYERRGVLYVPSTLFEDLTDNQLRVIRDRRRDDQWDRDNRNRNPRWPDRDDRGRFGDDVSFDNRPIRFDRDEEPFRSGNTLLVPAREMARLIGARVERPGDGNRLIFRYSRNEVVYDRGRNWYRINGRQVSLPTSSRDRRDVLYIPVEVFDALVDGRLSWNRR